MPGKMVEAIRFLPEADWKAFFDELAGEKARLIISEPPEKLASLQAKVQGITEMREFFIKHHRKE